jgi:hypothetical protein
MDRDTHARGEKLYGLLAELSGPDTLVAAARQVHDAGYRHMDAYTPMPVEGLAEAMGAARTRMPLVILIGGIVGAIGGFALQYWVSVVAYPLNVGGRPLDSWPAFIPVTFEMTILSAALFGVLGMLALNGLPKPFHPLFAVPEFDRATKNGFFLCIEASDPLFDAHRTANLLTELASGPVIPVHHTHL